MVVAGALGRVELVGPVGQIAVLAAGADHDREVRAGAREVGVGDDTPVNADPLQDGDHPLREAGFGGEVAARECRARGPEYLHLPAVNAQLHLQCLVAQQRRQRVVVSEIHQVHARLAAGGGPGPGIPIAGIPAGAVAELAGGAKALHVFHQRPGVADLRAGIEVAADGAQSGAGAALVGVHAIIPAEDVA